MQIGIVGASGFLGMNLMRHLLSAEVYHVHAWSRSKPAHSQVPRPRSWTLSNLSDRARLAQFVADLDVVFYLAHTGTPTTKFPLWQEAEENLAALLGFLEVLKSTRKKVKLVYSSSGGAIYGKSAKRVPWVETDVPHPVSSHGVLKLAAENYIRLAVLEGVCNALCLRIGNPYGNAFPHRGVQGLIDVTIGRTARGEAVTMFSPKETVRDFIYMDDLNAAWEACLKLDAAFEVINIGSGMGVSLSEVLDLIARLSKSPAKIDYNPVHDVHVVDWSVLNPKKAEALLGWKPSVALQNGIERSLQAAHLVAQQVD